MFSLCYFLCELLCFLSKINRYNFFPKGVGVNEAKDSLARIGATGAVNPGPGGSWVFMGYTGPDAVDWVTQVARPRYKGPCVVSEFVTLPAAAKAIEEEQEIPPPAMVEDVETFEYEESDDEADVSIAERSDRVSILYKYNTSTVKPLLSGHLS
jgi:hypothetical protein